MLVLFRDFSGSLIGDYEVIEVECVIVFNFGGNFVD